jgi:hypothetical protein
MDCYLGRSVTLNTAIREERRRAKGVNCAFSACFYELEFFIGECYAVCLLGGLHANWQSAKNMVSGNDPGTALGIA